MLFQKIRDTITDCGSFHFVLRCAALCMVLIVRMYLNQRWISVWNWRSARRGLVSGLFAAEADFNPSARGTQLWGERQCQLPRSLPGPSPSANLAGI